MSFEIKITADYEGVKPKNFLKKNLNLPYYKIVKLIQNKRITLNKKKINENSILKTNDIIKVWEEGIQLKQLESNTNSLNLKQKNLNLNIIFENSDFICFNKESGIIVQGSFDNQTSLSLHLNYLQIKRGDLTTQKYFHAHRLDKDTSGILLVAKTKKALREINSSFTKKNVTKIYYALCVGQFQKKSGEVELYLQKQENTKNEKMLAFKTKVDNSKYSKSIYTVEKEFQYKNQILSLVKIQILTGVTHQIRVHMKYLSHPIVGDIMYGNMKINKMFENILPRQFLHAYELKIQIFEKNYSFIAPFTADLNKCMKILETN